MLIKEEAPLADPHSMFAGAAALERQSLLHNAAVCFLDSCLTGPSLKLNLDQFRRALHATAARSACS